MALPTALCMGSEGICKSTENELITGLRLSSFLPSAKYYYFMYGIAAVATEMLHDQKWERKCP